MIFYFYFYTSLIITVVVPTTLTKLSPSPHTTLAKFSSNQLLLPGYCYMSYQLLFAWAQGALFAATSCYQLLHQLLLAAATFPISCDQLRYISSLSCYSLLLAATSCYQLLLAAINCCYTSYQLLVAAISCCYKSYQLLLAAISRCHISYQLLFV